MWWILILVIVGGIVSVVLAVSFSKKEEKKQKRYSSSSQCQWKKVEMSEYAKKYKPRPGFHNGSSLIFDQDGRRIIKYRVTEKTFDKYNGPKPLANIDSNEIMNFFKRTFFKNLNDDELCEKVKKIKKVMAIETGKFYTFDTDFFWKNNYIGLFPFNNSNQLTCEELKVYFKNRNIEVIELPATKCSQNYKNYLAFINLDNYEVLALLSYMQYKNGNRFIEKSYGFYSPCFFTEVKNNDEMIECIYSMLQTANFPRHDWNAEVFMRCLSGEGWPKPYELKTAYAMFKLEAANAGLIEYQNLREAKLFNLVKAYYKDALYQYNDDWLDPLSFDIFIPSLKIAIEFQGDQHERPVKYFGGKQAFEKIKENDAKKRQICIENNIKLIEWPYSLEITEANLKSLINN